MSSAIILTSDKTEKLDQPEPRFDPELLKGMNLTGFEDDDTKRLKTAAHLMGRNPQSLKPLLPLLLSLNGKPFSIDTYPQFEAFYRTHMPRKEVYKTGRQVSKTTSLAARAIIQSNCVPFLTTLFIAPLYETVRRFSQNYIRPFIDNSPVKRLFIGTSTMKSVLQRTFLNQSQMLFSYAYLDADRVRGISAQQCSIDETQDLDISLLPVILEVLSAAPGGGIEQYAGTPKGMENCLEGLWRSSSQAEWVIKCHRCGYFNVPTLTHDLDAMIGPLRDDISPHKPGIVCAKCGKYIFPNTGRWVHAKPDRRWQFVGRHVPQIVMQMHYGSYEKWQKLLVKRDGGGMPVNVFYNEVCGESYDTGSRIITLTELQQACVLPWNNALSETDPVHGKVKTEDYIFRVLACDWGGGGELMMSYTTFAVLGMKPDGKIDCIFGYRSLTPHDHMREARLAIGLAHRFKCQTICHDYTGAGSLRETTIVQAGFPLSNILPVAYVRAGGTSRVMSQKVGTKANPRTHFQVDKTRSLLLTCQQIKNGWIRFFQYDYQNVDDRGLIHDFLALVDEKADSRLGKDIYTIIRDPTMPDDFAQSVNIGCCTLWHMSDKWPNMAKIAHLVVPQSLLDAMHPPDKDVMNDML